MNAERLHLSSLSFRGRFVNRDAHCDGDKVLISTDDIGAVSTAMEVQSTKVIEENGFA